MPSVVSIIFLIISLISLLINAYMLGHAKGYGDGIQHCINRVEESRRELMEQMITERSDSNDTDN